MTTKFCHCKFPFCCRAKKLGQPNFANIVFGEFKWLNPCLLKLWIQQVLISNDHSDILENVFKSLSYLA